MKFYGTILILLVSFTASALAQNTSEVISKDDELRLPTSWEDYISLKRQLRAFGSFESSGVTTDVWDGIPAGLDFISTGTCQLSVDKTKILSTYEMKTKDGRLLSAGGGTTFWDGSRKKIFSSGSGFDGGQFYSGPGILKGLNKSKEVWTYTETINGKKYDNQRVTEMVNYDMFRDIESRVDGTKGSLITNSTRIADSSNNTPRSTFEDFQSFCKVMTGRWRIDITYIADWPGVGVKKGEKGTGYALVDTKMDGHVLDLIHINAGLFFRQTFYWDPVDSVMTVISIMSSGAIWHGTFWENDEKGYTFKINRAGEKDGRHTTGEFNYVFSEDKNTFYLRSNNMTLGHEKLDDLRDVYFKVSE